MVDAVSRGLPPGVTAVHVMDREADAYGLLAHWVTNRHRFVIRLAYNRNVQSGLPVLHKLRAVLEKSRVVLKREVNISARKAAWRRPKVTRRHLPRMTRLANLSCRVATVTLLKPPFAGETYSSPEVSDSITVNIVQVYARKPPVDVVPIEWLLATTDPIGSNDEISQVIDCYRARWMIEEFFKAIKTGCGYEQRQLEKRLAFLNALALLVPIAVENACAAESCRFR